MSCSPESPLRAWWRGQQYAPGLAGLLVNPFYFARRGLLRGLREFFSEMRGEVLDVGCGRKPYRRFIPAERYVGLEIDTREARALGCADAYYNGRTFPFADASFDAVFCSQVLEHVFTPAEFLSEIRRMLRPGGRLLLTVPFVWDEHEQPRDCARYSSFGLRALLERHDFAVEAQRKTCADFRAIVQLASGVVYKITRTEHRGLNILVQLLLVAPVNVLGGLVAWVLPRNADFYLDNIVLARRRDTSP